MSRSSDAQAIIDQTLAGAPPATLDPNGWSVVVVPEGGEAKVFGPRPDSELDAPRRVKGETTVFDVDSLAALWDKYATASSELYADPAAFRITAVFNADHDAAAGLADFRDHRAVLVCRLTPAWNAWLAKDGQYLDQTAFAEFLEDRLVDIVDPSGADMLELATTFQATTKVDFESNVVLSSDQRQLVYKETLQAKAGQTGRLEVPTHFTVALQPFEASAAFRVVARLRYRINNGHLAIGYRLERPDDVLREAFGDVRQAADEACGASSLFGTAPAAR